MNFQQSLFLKLSILALACAVKIVNLPFR